jgi:hypothetical protein
LTPADLVAMLRCFTAPKVKHRESFVIESLNIAYLKDGPGPLNTDASLDFVGGQHLSPMYEDGTAVRVG